MHCILLERSRPRQVHDAWRKKLVVFSVRRSATKCALTTRPGRFHVIPTIHATLHNLDAYSNKTEIKFMTDGTLMHELVKDPKLSKYSYIILDEAHVATVNASFLLPFLKRICKERPSDFKLIVSRQEFKFK